MPTLGGADELKARLERLERSCRRWRWATVVGLLISLGAIATAGPWKRATSHPWEQTDQIVLHGIGGSKMVLDGNYLRFFNEQGRERIEIGYDPLWPRSKVNLMDEEAGVSAHLGVNGYLKSAGMSVRDSNGMGGMETTSEGLRTFGF
jgi:hypothetical protein